jgi:hypothetical protein
MTHPDCSNLFKSGVNVEAVAECLPSNFDKTKYNQAKDVLEQLEHGLKQLNKK